MRLSVQSGRCGRITLVHDFRVAAGCREAQHQLGAPPDKVEGSMLTRHIDLAVRGSGEQRLVAIDARFSVTFRQNERCSAKSRSPLTPR
jgi:hypothetical protein